MITKPTIDRIMEATDIVEVIGEFVQLKKRGANYVGLSPFANERTPSFTVSPAKGIFKDFSSGKGGSVVTFLMELEKFSYPEALKWLAKKYSIEVEETVDVAENREDENHRESLMIVTGYAAKFFHDSLLETDEGKSIGLSYFKERGFTSETIRKFELGYSPDQWEAFTGQALNDGYQQEFLEETGLSVKRENGSLYDRYRGRVMFPIHSFTGRVIAFGGRTLKNDKNVPKYVNSPESEIYHKSNVLYGLYFAKKAIREEDNCFLVEGYADVLSVHQAGIENVVASSGTSLTSEQIRLIGRITKNITILYDGDAAGIKASLRGLDMILEEGLNVKVVLFPDGHDPDSYVRNFGTNGFKKHIEENKKDFILFKADTLLKDAGNDPIKKAGVIREIVESIAKIPDSIKASIFIKECSYLLDIDERALLSELNKMRLAKSKKNAQQAARPIEDFLEFDEPKYAKNNYEDDVAQEKSVIFLLMMYGETMVDWKGIGEMLLGSFILAEIADIEIENLICKAILNLYKSELDNGRIPTSHFFIHNRDSTISEFAADLLAEKYDLADWESRKIRVPPALQLTAPVVVRVINRLKRKKLGKMKSFLMERLKETNDELEQMEIQRQIINLKQIDLRLNNDLGTIIIH
jgi:DNA primase